MIDLLNLFDLIRTPSVARPSNLNKINRNAADQLTSYMINDKLMFVKATSRMAVNGSRNQNKRQGQDRERATQRRWMNEIKKKDAWITIEEIELLLSPWNWLKQPKTRNLLLPSPIKREREGRIHQSGEPWRPPYLPAGETPRPQPVSHGRMRNRGRRRSGSKRYFYLSLGPIKWAVYSIRWSPCRMPKGTAALRAYSSVCGRRRRFSFSDLRPIVLLLGYSLRPWASTAAASHCWPAVAAALHYCWMLICYCCQVSSSSIRDVEFWSSSNTEGKEKKNCRIKEVL